MRDAGRNATEMRRRREGEREGASESESRIKLRYARQREPGESPVISLKLEGCYCDLRFSGNLQLDQLSRPFERGVFPRREPSHRRASDAEINVFRHGDNLCGEPRSTDNGWPISVERIRHSDRSRPGRNRSFADGRSAWKLRKDPAFRQTIAR